MTKPPARAPDKAPPPKAAAAAERLQTRSAAFGDLDQTTYRYRYVQGRTVCQVCGQPVKVTRTVQEPRDDGTVLVTRYVRCTHRQAHTMPLREILRPETPPAGGLNLSRDARG